MAHEINGKYLTVVRGMSLVESRELKPAQDGMFMLLLSFPLQIDQRKVFYFRCEFGKNCLITIS